MGDLDVRLISWAIWGVGTLIVYGLLFRKRLRHNRRHHDPRSRRDAVQSFGYFLVAIASFVGITVALFGPQGEGVGRVLFASAAAIFFVVGVYALMDADPENGGTAKARRQ